MGVSKASPVRAFLSGAEIRWTEVSGPRLQTLMGLTPHARLTRSQLPEVHLANAGTHPATGVRYSLALSPLLDPRSATGYREEPFG
jgi:hypothetical protein